METGLVSCATWSRNIAYRQTVLVQDVPSLKLTVRPCPKRKFIFQPPTFRGELLVSGSVFICDMLLPFAVGTLFGDNVQFCEIVFFRMDGDACSATSRCVPQEYQYNGKHPRKILSLTGWNIKHFSLGLDSILKTRLCFSILVGLQSIVYSDL